MTVTEWMKGHWTKLLIGFIIFLVVGFMIYYFFKPGAYICGPGTMQDNKCGTGGCIKICSTWMKYDCSKHACVCDASQGLAQCGDSCCPTGSIQHPDPTNPDLCVCCSNSQICGDQCCPTGQTCSTDKKTCVVGCGINTDGSPHSCASNQTCITIDNIPSSDIAKFQNDPDTVVTVDPTTGLGTAYMCHDPEACNVWTNQRALPPAINNWYPCLNFMDTDPAGGVGFCSSATDDPAAIATCRAKSKDQCSSPCNWINIFDQTSQGTTGWTNLDTNIKRMAGGFGDWCAQGSSGRVVAVDFDPSTCTWKDCWSKLAQNNVIDLDYDDASGRCVAIQTCNTASGLSGISSSAADPSTDAVTYTGGNLFIKDCNQSSADSCSPDFGHCPDLLCDPNKRPPIVLACDGNGALLDAKKRWVCATGGAAAGCIDVGPGQGVYNDEETCMANCTCPAGFKEGLDPSNPTKCARVAPFTLKSAGYAVCSPTHSAFGSCNGCNTDDEYTNGCVAGKGVSGYNDVLPIGYQAGPNCGDCSRDTPDFCHDSSDSCCDNNYMGIGDSVQVYPQNAVYCRGNVNMPSDTDDRTHYITSYKWQICNDKSPDWDPSSSICLNPHYHGPNTKWGNSGFWKVDSTYTKGNSITNYCYENDLPGTASCHNV